jgi:hypothetical protein
MPRRRPPNPLLLDWRANEMSRAVPAGLILLLLALPVYVLRLNGVAGMMVDDAWYLLLARSLADGTGYKLISSPADAILPLYPPGHPALLSLVFRAAPEFPQNVPLLKAVSIAAMMGVGLLTFSYLRKHRQQSPVLAGGIAVATAILPAFVFLATSTLMSECVFTLAQLAAVVLAHRSVESPDRRRSMVMALSAAAVAAAAVLVRSAAAGLVVAVALWLIKERLWKPAAVFATAVALFLLPWLAYANVHAPTRQQRMHHGGAIVFSYGEQFWMRWAGAPASGQITVAELPARIATNATDIFARSAGGIFVPAFFRGPDESGEEVVALGPASMGTAGVTMAISLTLSAIVLVGFITAARRRITVAEFLVPIAIAIILVWPFWSFRFVLPLTPFLFFYLIEGLQVVTRSLRATRIVLLCLIGLNLFDHAGYILHGRQPGLDWLDDAAEVEAALDWIDLNLPPDGGAIASSNSALIYLRTGRKSLAYDDPTISLAAWRARGVRYLVCLRPMNLPTGMDREYRVLYQSGRRWIIELQEPRIPADT